MKEPKKPQKPEEPIRPEPHIPVDEEVVFHIFTMEVGLKLKIFTYVELLEELKVVTENFMEKYPLKLSRVENVEGLLKFELRRDEYDDKTYFYVHYPFKRKVSEAENKERARIQEIYIEQYQIEYLKWQNKMKEYEEKMIKYNDWLADADKRELAQTEKDIRRLENKRNILRKKIKPNE